MTNKEAIKIVLKQHDQEIEEIKERLDRMDELITDIINILDKFAKGFIKIK